jgi:hypothetical protein
MTIRLRSLVLGLGLLLAVPALAQVEHFRAGLRGFEEVPALSNQARGQFRAELSEDGTELTYTLSYRQVQGVVTQAHIHLGNPSVNGGIMVFLCSNIGNGPAGTQGCPADPAVISGTITADDVLAIAAQDLPAHSFREFRNAVRQGYAYANVHSTLYPGGELRGQICQERDEDGDDDDEDDDEVGLVICDD